MDAKDFGGRVFQARLDEASDRSTTLTQAEVARDMGVTATTVRRWENNEKEPNLATIERLARVLGTTASWLAYGTGERRATRDELERPRPTHNKRPAGKAGRGAKRSKKSS